MFAIWDASGALRPLFSGVVGGVFGWVGLGSNAGVGSPRHVFTDRHDSASGFDSQSFRLSESSRIVSARLYFCISLVPLRRFGVELGPHRVPVFLLVAGMPRKKRAGRWSSEVRFLKKNAERYRFFGGKGIRRGLGRWGLVVGGRW
ncbi:hypothetical protein ES703_87326 [subsurface metagenome]